jgi:hypothetical protein
MQVWWLGVARGRPCDPIAGERRQEPEWRTAVAMLSAEALEKLVGG